MDNNLVELARALNLIQKTCESFKSTDCNWTSGDIKGKCTICQVLQCCPIDEVPEQWRIKEEFKNEIE